MLGIFGSLSSTTFSLMVGTFGGNAGGGGGLHFLPRKVTISADHSITALEIHLVIVQNPLIWGGC